MRAEVTQEEGGRALMTYMEAAEAAEVLTTHSFHQAPAYHCGRLRKPMFTFR